MRDKTVKIRNAIIRALYKNILKPLLFLRDPEKVHDNFIRFGSFLGSSPLTRGLTRLAFGYSDPSLKQEVLGIDFENPIGLAAGFDKDAKLTDVLPAVGFGFMEVGSITGSPCIGNPKPRLWRLKKSRGLLVYYGLKNRGADIVAREMKEKKLRIPTGVSVAMTNSADNLDQKKAVADYVKAFESFANIGDYTTINISCPNSQGGIPFQDPMKLDTLLENLDHIPNKKPIFVKLSADLSRVHIDAIITILRRHRIDGIICANLAKDRDSVDLSDRNIPEVGGISGKPIQNLADRLLAYIYRKAGDRFILVGCGGVFTAEDAYRKIRIGASLVQLVTGMIYEGPQAISEINRGLVELLRRDGYKNISEAIGVDNR